MRRPSDEAMIVFPEKWNAGKRKRERERARGDDDCFPLLAWLILPTEEIVRLSLVLLIDPSVLGRWPAQYALHLSIPFSPSLFFLSLRLSFGFYYVFSDNCFSLQIILQVKSFSNEQIVIKSYKFLHYSVCKNGNPELSSWHVIKKRNTSGSFAS